MFSIPAQPNLVESRWNSTLSLCGAAMWASFAALAGLHRAPFGTIELLFLFAVLVIVPLGMELAALISPGSRAGTLHHALQAIAMLTVSIAFWLPPGRTAGVLSVMWLVACLTFAGKHLSHARHRPRNTLSMLVEFAYADLVLGAAWLVASRARFHVMGFQEPIILLTAVHFHYSGFAAALIAAATWHEFQTRRLSMPGLQTLVWLVAVLPFVLAAGFVASPPLRFIAAMSLSTSVTVLALISSWMASEWQSGPARTYLRLAALASVGAFSLAGVYAVSEYFHKDWITIPGMANSHGVLNGMGFVLLGVLGWLLELHGRGTSASTMVAASTPETSPKSEPTVVLARQREARLPKIIPAKTAV